MGLSGVLVGFSFILIGAGNYVLLLGNTSGLNAEITGDVLTLVVSAVVALIGFSVLSLSVRFTLGRAYTANATTIAFVVYAGLLTLLSFLKGMQLDADAILNGELAVMILLIGGASKIRYRFRWFISGFALAYMGLLLLLAQGYSTSSVIAFMSPVTLPTLGMLFSWRPFELAAFFLAGAACFASGLKKRSALTIAYAALLSYSLGVIIPLFPLATHFYDLIAGGNPGSFSALLSSSPKLVGVIILVAGNASAVVASVAGIVLSRRGPPSEQFNPPARLK